MSWGREHKCPRPRVLCSPVLSGRLEAVAALDHHHRLLWRPRLGGPWPPKKPAHAKERTEKARDHKNSSRLGDICQIASTHFRGCRNGLYYEPYNHDCSVIGQCHVHTSCSSDTCRTSENFEFTLQYSHIQAQVSKTLDKDSRSAILHTSQQREAPVPRACEYMRAAAYNTLARALHTRSVLVARCFFLRGPLTPLLSGPVVQVPYMDTGSASFSTRKSVVGSGMCAPLVHVPLFTTCGGTAMKTINTRFVTRSFVDGNKVCFVHAKRTETDVLADAVRLERCGKVEEAELLLETYCNGSSQPGRLC